MTYTSFLAPSCYNINPDAAALRQCGIRFFIYFAARPKDNRRKILFDCR